MTAVRWYSASKDLVNKRRSLLREVVKRATEQLEPSFSPPSSSSSSSSSASSSSSSIALTELKRFDTPQQQQQQQREQQQQRPRSLPHHRGRGLSERTQSALSAELVEAVSSILANDRQNRSLMMFFQSIWYFLTLDNYGFIDAFDERARSSARMAPFWIDEWLLAMPPTAAEMTEMYEEEKALRRRGGMQQLSYKQSLSILPTIKDCEDAGEDDDGGDVVMNQNALVTSSTTPLPPPPNPPRPPSPRSPAPPSSSTSSSSSSHPVFTPTPPPPPQPPSSSLPPHFPRVPSIPLPPTSLTSPLSNTTADTITFMNTTATITANGMTTAEAPASTVTSTSADGAFTVGSAVADRSSVVRSIVQMERGGVVHSNNSNNKYAHPDHGDEDDDFTKYGSAHGSTFLNDESFPYIQSEAESFDRAEREALSKDGAGQDLFRIAIDYSEFPTYLRSPIFGQPQEDLLKPVVLRPLLRTAWVQRIATTRLYVTYFVLASMFAFIDIVIPVYPPWSKLISMVLMMSVIFVECHRLDRNVLKRILRQFEFWYTWLNVLAYCAAFAA